LESPCGPLHMLRYDSREAALAGHARIIELVRAYMESQESQLKDLLAEIREKVSQDVVSTGKEHQV